MLNADFTKLRSSNMQPKLYDRFVIVKLDSAIYNKSAQAYRQLLRYSWQNVGYDIGGFMDFTSVIDVAFSTDVIECAGMTCGHLFFTVRFVVIRIALRIFLEVLTCIYSQDICITCGLYSDICSDI